MRKSFTSFSGGETSDLLDERSALPQVARSLRVCQNMELTRYGSLDKRNGTDFIALAKGTSNVILRRFRFSTTTKQMLEFGAGYVRFYENGAPVMDGNDPLELVTPYLAEELNDLHFQPRDDLLYIAHPNHYPRLMSRVANDEWTIEKAPFDGPFEDVTDEFEDVTLTADANEGTVNLNSSIPFFTASMVGERIQFVCKQASFTATTEQDEADDTTKDLSSDNISVGEEFRYIDPVTEYRLYFTCIAPYTAGVHYVPGQDNPAEYPDFFEVGQTLWGQEWVGGVWEFSTGGEWKGEWRVQSREYDDDENDWFDEAIIVSNTLTGTPIFTAGDDAKPPRWFRIQLVSRSRTTDSEPVSLRFEQADIPTSILITSVTTPPDPSTQAVGEIQTYLKCSSSDSVNVQQWGVLNGYPNTVAWADDRLVFSGTRRHPMRYWFSQIKVYENFVEDTLANSPFQLDTIGEDSSIVQWLASREELFSGTASAEALLVPRDREKALSVENPPRANWFASEGGAHFQPAYLNASWFAVQAGAETLHEYKYSLAVDRYEPEEATLLHESILASKAVWMSTRYEPEKALLITKGDGTVVGFTHKPNAQLAGWWRWETDGEILCAEGLRGDGVEDEIWLAVKRDGQICIERMRNGNRAQRRAGNQAVLNYLDCATQTEQPGQVSVSGLDRFEGKTVTYLADGVKGTGTVTGGILQLQTPADVVIVGLPYEVLVEVHSIESFGENFSTVSKRKSGPVQVLTSFWKSVGGQVSTTEGKWYDLKMVHLVEENPLGNRTYAMRTGVTRTPVDQRGGWKKRFAFRQVDPYPFTILGLYAEHEAGDL